MKQAMGCMIAAVACIEGQSVLTRAEFMEQAVRLLDAMVHTFPEEQFVRKFGKKLSDIKSKDL